MLPWHFHHLGCLRYNFLAPPLALKYDGLISLCWVVVLVAGHFVAGFSVVFPLAGGALEPTLPTLFFGLLEPLNFEQFIRLRYNTHQKIDRFLAPSSIPFASKKWSVCSM